MDMRIPPLKNNIMLESNPLKSTMLVGRLGVTTCCFVHLGSRRLVAIHAAMGVPPGTGRRCGQDDPTVISYVAIFPLNYRPTFV